MNNRFIFLTVVAFGIGVVSQVAQAQMLQARSLPLLEMGQDARTVAMGSSHYGISKGAHLYTNPAALSFEEATKISATATWRKQSLSVEDPVSLDTYSMTGGIRLGQHSIMLGGRYFKGPKVTTMDISEVTSTSGHFGESSLDFGYAFRFGRLALYGTGSYVISTLGGSSKSTYVFGMGAFYRNKLQNNEGNTWSYLVGVKAQNIGPYFRYEGGQVDVQPPFFAGLGGEASYEIPKAHKLTVGLSGDHYFMPYRAMSMVFRGGAEYCWKRMLSIRVGYLYDTNQTKGFTMGVGFQYHRLAIDSAFVTAPSDGVTSSLHLTLGLNI